jgi:hypothetical protein
MMHSDPFSSWMAGSRNGERQKKKDLEKGSWKEDLEHSCGEFTTIPFMGWTNLLEATYLCSCSHANFYKRKLCLVKDNFCNFQLEVEM